MKAAFYARYSTYMQREASIDDQYRNCQAQADREAWAVVARYKDKAMSGTDADRPGFNAMMADAMAGQFDVLIVDDLSRMSRDDIAMKMALRRLAFRNVRVIAVSDGFDTDSKNHKVQAFARSFQNELYVDDLRAKTHRGMTGQAQQGNNTGGRSYGYRHVPIEDPKRLDEYGRPVIIAVTREVDPEQAKWVEQIFQWYAGSHPPRWIAAELNRLRIPSPRGGTWAGSAIHGDMSKGTGLLNNELYIGNYIWNRSRWVRNPDTGRKTRIARPKEEWVTKEMPALRIVSADLWDRVKARQKIQRERGVAIRVALHKNARTGAGPKYLFSGLLKCHCCGANYVIVDNYRYGCAKHRDRGPDVCSNGLKVPRKLVEERLLEGIKRDLFTDEGIALFKKEVARLLAERARSQGRDNDKAKRRLAAVENEIENIMVAIKQGILTTTTKAELQKAEAEKASLEKAMNANTSSLDNIPTLLPRATDRFRALIDNLEGVTQAQVARARTNIKALVGGEISLIPMEGGYLEAELRGNYAGLIRLANQSPGGKAGGGSKLSVVAGAGFEPATFRL
ncbi:MAG: recombinase family protein [Proteobacteria bacterium]|nr:recombinase family protein [Pseudomonadota bacterium]